jgi:deazaflavin-dependent oxidoreductase (nitroreductase family)
VSESDEIPQDQQAQSASGPASQAAQRSPYYRRPGSVTRRVVNPGLTALNRIGLSVWGSRTLEVRGRSSGTARRTPVNVLLHEGREYLVSARGEGQWIRNVRADGGRLTLLRGRKRDERIATELTDAEKPAVLRAYLKRWKMEVGAFFDGVDARSPDTELRRIAPDHPVFVLSDSTR